MVETVYSIGTPVSIALLPDFHSGRPEPVLESLRLHRPDLIAVPGDFVVGSVPAQGLKMLHSGTSLDFLRGCAGVAPTFVSLGNHEWMLAPEDISLIEETGCTVLDNSWVEHDSLVIGGLTSGRVSEYRKWRSLQPSFPRYPYNGTPSRSARLVPDTAWLRAYVQTPGYHVLLCHHPEYWRYLKYKNIELILSGHAHGGQWRIRNHGIYAPGQGFWPELTSGVLENRLVISRGLSNSELIPRLNNPTEMVYIQ